jgi:type I restriction enzyme S subunit
VRLNKGIALPEFFVTYLQAGKAREYFLRCAKRTTNLASINMTQLRDLPLVLPTLDKQQIFADRFAEVRSIQSQQTSATAKAKATFDALLNQAFSPA